MSTEFAAKRFNFYVPITKSTQSEDGDWIVEGPLSEPGEDLQGETMDMRGLRKGLKVFERLGQNCDWEHLYRQTKDPAFLIGKGIQIFDAEHPKTGEMVPWLRAKLFKNKKIARNAIEHLNEGGTLGWSVEGGAIRKSGSHIAEPIITMATLTPQPVVAENAGTVSLVKGLAELATRDWDEVELPTIPDLLSPVSDEVFQKALEATGAVPRQGPGANALETEQLGGGKAASREWDEECPHCGLPPDECRCGELKKALAFQLSEELVAQVLARAAA